jgi:hypothetical protein
MWANAGCPVVIEVLNSFRLTLDHLRRLVADLPDELLAEQPHGVVNHPAWIIGHLTHSCEAMAGELGASSWLPDDWSRRFGAGSVPTADRSGIADPAELLRDAIPISL